MIFVCRIGKPVIFGNLPHYAAGRPDGNNVCGNRGGDHTARTDHGIVADGNAGKYRIEEVTKLLQTGKILEEFDRVMFKSLVRKITVLSNKEIEIEFEYGIPVRETL